MSRYVAVSLLVLATMAGPLLADDTVQVVPIGINNDASTLRLYFDPAIKGAKGGTDFVPEVARLFVDNVYVGDAIVNLHGHIPTLNFGQGAHTIRVEMTGNRSFESKMTFLGRGSIQYLFVKFDSNPATAKQ